MKIKVIKNIGDFEAVKDDWNYVFKYDTKATVFQSWSWLRGWIDVIASDWFIISIQTDSESQYIAFFALYKESTPGLFGMRTYHTLKMAGEPVIDYTGMLCLPEYEDAVIEYIASVLQREVHWSKFMPRNVSDTRVIKIVRRFETNKYTVQYMEDTACPRLILPDNWEKYLHEVLQPKYSKKLKYTLRRAEKEGCYIVRSTNDNMELSINNYLKLHEMRWNEIDEKLKRLYISTFKYLFDADLLQMDTLFYQNDAIGMLVAFTDKGKKIFHFYNGGWSSEFARFSPGTVLIGSTIKYAIQNGYKVYDFTRGDEAYKYSFGCENKYTKNIVITRNNFENKLRIMKNRFVKYATPS